MKTKLAYQNGFPRPTGLVIIMILTSLVCLLNCAFGSEPEKAEHNSAAVMLAADLEAGTEIAPAVERWMTSLEEFAGESEARVELEEWMLHPFDAVEPEEVPALEAWMLDPGSFSFYFCNRRKMDQPSSSLTAVISSFF